MTKEDTPSNKPALAEVSQENSRDRRKKEKDAENYTTKKK